MRVRAVEVQSTECRGLSEEFKAQTAADARLLDDVRRPIEVMLIGGYVAYLRRPMLPDCVEARSLFKLELQLVCSPSTLTGAGHAFYPVPSHQGYARTKFDSNMLGGKFDTSTDGLLGASFCQQVTSARGQQDAQLFLTPHAVFPLALASNFRDLAD